MLMPSTMPTELTLLVWSVALCVAQMLVAVITAQAQVSLPPLIGNREDFPELKGIAGRAARAHTNMISNLVMFAALALVAVVASRTNGMTALGAPPVFLGPAGLCGHLPGGHSLAAHRCLGGFHGRPGDDVPAAALVVAQPRSAKLARFPDAIPPAAILR
jgi:uncharacterized MAPEG superfamily protein